MTGSGCGGQVIAPQEMESTQRGRVCYPVSARLLQRKDFARARSWIGCFDTDLAIRSPYGLVRGYAIHVRNGSTPHALPARYYSEAQSQVADR